LTLTAGANTPAGTYIVTLTGKGPGGSPTHTATVTFVVTAAPAFTLGASPSSRSVRRGNSTTYTVSIARGGGFASSVSLSVSGLKSGATGTFSPNPATGTSSTLTIKTVSNATTGSSTLTMTGTGGSLTRQKTVSLSVTR
jgi:hypothetical protein